MLNQQNKFIRLSVEKEILAMRKDIENYSQHAGQNFELVKQAYDDIQIAQGKQKSKYTSSCSGCIMNINLILNNWIKMYDQLGASEQRVIKAPEYKPLNPIKVDNKSQESNEPSYRELLDKFNSTATSVEKASVLNGRKTASKKELIDFLNGK